MQIQEIIPQRILKNVLQLQFDLIVFELKM